ncbi:MAG: hypothetical protein WBE92_07645 [Steroidobacteraceae bacterium]
MRIAGEFVDVDVYRPKRAAEHDDRDFSDIADSDDSGIVIDQSMPAGSLPWDDEPSLDTESIPSDIDAEEQLSLAEIAEGLEAD